MRTGRNIVSWPFRMWDQYIWNSRAGLTFMVIWYIIFTVTNTFQGDHGMAIFDAFFALFYLIRWNVLTKRLRDTINGLNIDTRTPR